MQVIFVLIVVSLLVAGGFLLAFRHAINTKQFDDLHTPAMRILFDNEISKNKEGTK